MDRLGKTFKPAKWNVTHELLFVLYFWGFTMLRPILQIFPDKSRFILLVFATILLIISLFKILSSGIVIKGYKLIAGVLFVLLCDLLFRPNIYTSQFIYEFIIYGLIPIHLLSQVKDTTKLLKTYSFFSVIVFILFFIDPFIDYATMEDYMTFGFSFALPAYFGLYIGRKIFGFKWILPIELICLLELVVFANRSTILSVVLLWVILEIFYVKRSIKKSVRIIVAISSFPLFLFFLQDILNWTNALLRKYDYYSYSLYHLQLYISQRDWVGLFSGRFDIWNQAINIINENIIIGSGTGIFQARHGYYVHNIFYDIILQYGLLGLILLILLFIKSWINISRQKESTKLVGLFLFCLWFPKLLFSAYIFKDIGFWCFLAYGFILFSGKSEEKLNRRLSSS